MYKSASQLIKILSVVLVLISFASTENVQAQDYLEASELAIIGVSGVAAAVVGLKVRILSQNHTPLIRGHLPLDLTFQRWLGCGNEGERTNILDSKVGSAFTPVAFGTILSSANLIFPRNSGSKDFGQDLFLFISGAVATTGLTDIAKGIVARERPFYALASDRSAIENQHNSSFLRHSFFSGHASSAFFSSTFLNIRLRDTMQRRMTPSEYNSWKKVSSGVLFGWASLVGLSRVQAGKHYLSDVIVGAVVGTLMAELFYGLGESENGAGTPTQLRIVIPF